MTCNLREREIRDRETPDVRSPTNGRSVKPKPSVTNEQRANAYKARPVELPAGIVRKEQETLF